MAADKRVNVVIGGDSTGAQKALGDVGKKAEETATSATKAFKQVAQTLTTGGGGAFATLAESMDAVQKGFDVVAEHGKTVGGVLLGAGAAGVAAGAMLMKAASDDVAAHQQLAQAIVNTGDTIEDFDGRIDKLDGQFQKFGDASETTEQALRILVQSTGDTGKAIDTMGVAADLAAAKHESLGAASQQLALILEGKGARTLQQFGLSLADFKDKADGGTLAVQALAEKIQGQASAASDTFAGKLAEGKAKLEDFVGEMGQKFGPALLAVSSGMTVAGGAVEGASAVIGHFTKSAEEATVAAEGLAGAEAEAEAAGIGLGTGLGAAAVTLGALYVAFRSQGTIIDENTSLTKKYTDSLSDMKNGVRATFDTLASGALSTEKATSTLEALGLTQKQVTDATNGTKGELGQLYDALGKTTAGNKQATDAFQALRMTVGDIQWGQETAGATQYNLAISKLGASAFQELIGYSGASEAAINTVNAAFADGTISAGELNLSSDDLAKTMTILQKAMDAQAASAKESKAESAAVGVKFQTMADAAKAATSDLGQLKNALDIVIGGGVSAAKATDDYYKALDDLTASVKANGTSLDEHTDKGRKNREAISASAQAAITEADAMVKQGASTDQAKGFLNGYIDSLRAQLVASGLSKDAVDAYITSLGLTPEKVDTAITISNQQKAHDDVQAHLNQLDTIPKDKKTEIQALIDHGNFAVAQAEIDALTSPRTVQVRADISQFLAKIPIIGAAAAAAANPTAHAAMGGSFRAGDVVQVGEQGPETVVFGQPATVVPHGQSALGGVTVHQTNNFYGPVGPDQIGDLLEQKMQDVAQQVFAGSRS